MRLSMSLNSSPNKADAQAVKWLGDALLWELERQFGAARELSPQAKLSLWCAAVDLLVRNSTYQDKDHALS